MIRLTGGFLSNLLDKGSLPMYKFIERLAFAVWFESRGSIHVFCSSKVGGGTKVI